MTPIPHMVWRPPKQRGLRGGLIHMSRYTDAKCRFAAKGVKVIFKGPRCMTLNVLLKEALAPGRAEVHEDAFRLWCELRENKSSLLFSWNFRTAI